MVNYYMINRQKLLFMVRELHKLGFEKLRIVPSLSPSGLYWRCEFVSDTEKIVVSNWIDELEGGNSQEIKFTPQELADLFVNKKFDFLEKCKGINKQYVEWYSEMLHTLKEGELPYAFDYSDYFEPTDYWKTSEDNKIKTLPNEKDYYFKNEK